MLAFNSTKIFYSYTILWTRKEFFYSIFSPNVCPIFLSDLFMQF